MTEKLEAYILVYPNGKLVGIDSNKEGSPYPIDSFYEKNSVYCWRSKVNLFPTLKAAEDYQKHFKNLIIKKVCFQAQIFDV